MRVLMLSTDRKMFEEGSAVSARMRDYAGLFERLDVIVFTRRGTKMRRIELAEHASAHPTRSFSRLLYGVDARLLARSLGKRQRYDVVSAQDPFETGMTGLFIARMLGVPLHVQVHTDLWSPYFSRVEPGNRIRQFLAGFVLEHAAAVRVVSEKLKRDVEGRFPRLVGKVAVLPIFSERAGVSQAETPSFPGFSPVILCASRLERSKNVRGTLEVFQGILASYPQALLLVAGDGKLRAPLARLSKRLGLQGHVRFLGWVGDLAPYYQTADVFLSTSWYEGYGLSLVEAAQAGLPIVSSDAGIAPELARSGHATVCAPDDTLCFIRSLADEFGRKRRLEPYQAGVGTKEEYLARYKESLELCPVVKNGIVQEAPGKKK
jgi:glycosyltransferase involved in cell wall biosynthesis